MLLGLASACYAVGSYEQAAEYIFKASDLHPDEPKPYLFLGKVQRREITESTGYKERLERFARLQPDNALANYYFAVCLWNRRQELDAAQVSLNVLDLLKKALTIDPHLAAAYLQLGIVASDERKYRDAITAYRNAITADPDLEEAHYRLSEAYARTGDRLKAQQELALYQKLSKASADKLERERHETQQFVMTLRNQDQ